MSGKLGIDIGHSFALRFMDVQGMFSACNEACEFTTDTRIGYGISV